MGSADSSGTRPLIDAGTCVHLDFKSALHSPVDSRRISSASTAAAADLNTPPAPASARSAAVRGRTPANLPNSSRTGTQDCLRRRPCVVHHHGIGRKRHRSPGSPPCRSIKIEQDKEQR